MSKSFGEAAEELLSALARGETIKIRKRATRDMVWEYISKGWQVWGTEGNSVVLVWLHDEVPQ